MAILNLGREDVVPAILLWLEMEGAQQQPPLLKTLIKRRGMVC